MQIHIIIPVSLLKLYKACNNLNNLDIQAQLLLKMSKKNKTFLFSHFINLIVCLKQDSAR